MICFLVVLVVDFIPLTLFIRLIDRRCHIAHVRGKRQQYLAVLGWGIGLATMSAANVFLNKSFHIDDDLWDLTFIPSGLLGGTLGAGASYLHLRMKTTTDADYDDSHVADGASGH